MRSELEGYPSSSQYSEKVGTPGEGRQGLPATTQAVHRVDAQVNPAVGTCLEMKEGASQPLPGLPSAHGDLRVDELLNHGVDLIWDLKQKQVSGIVGLPIHRVLDGS